eukprot:425109-Pleurochrysis_carterae.AAC.1
MPCSCSTGAEVAAVVTEPVDRLGSCFFSCTLCQYSSDSLFDNSRHAGVRPEISGGFSVKAEERGTHTKHTSDRY